MCLEPDAGTPTKGNYAHLLHGSIAEMTVRPANFDLASFSLSFMVYGFLLKVQSANATTSVALPGNEAVISRNKEATLETLPRQPPRNTANLELVFAF